MNRLFGEIPLFLSLEHVFNWVDVSKNIARLDATYLTGILYRHRSGLRVLPSPDRVDDKYTVTPQVVEALLTLMRTMFDYVIIDSGQAVDDISKMILRSADKVLLVSGLSMPCLINVKKLMKTFRDLGYPPEPWVEVVVNRFDKKSVITLREAEQSIGKKVFWVVPNDFHATMSAINQGKPLSLVEPELPRSPRRSRRWPPPWRAAHRHRQREGQGQARIPGAEALLRRQSCPYTLDRSHCEG